jgi:hypothetical protein
VDRAVPDPLGMDLHCPPTNLRTEENKAFTLPPSSFKQCNSSGLKLLHKEQKSHGILVKPKGLEVRFKFLQLLLAVLRLAHLSEPQVSSVLGVPIFQHQTYEWTGA